MAGNVYELIAKVQGELASTGISKDHKNQQQKYSFRGIDDVYNALAPLLANHGLVILPNVLNREVVERESKQGSALFYVTVQVRFDFVSSHDSTKHEVVTFGEAMDSGDKATNKAMSAAFKYACLQTFCIPTEGDNDADATTHTAMPQASDRDISLIRTILKDPKVFTDDDRRRFEDKLKAGMTQEQAEKALDYYKTEEKARRDTLNEEAAGA